MEKDITELYQELDFLVPDEYSLEGLRLEKNGVTIIECENEEFLNEVLKNLIQEQKAKYTPIDLCLADAKREIKENGAYIYDASLYGVENIILITEIYDLGENEYIYYIRDTVKALEDMGYRVISLDNDGHCIVVDKANNMTLEELKELYYIEL